MKEPRRHLTDIVFTLSLFGLFVIVSLTLVLMGANVYRDTHEEMTANYDVRTSLVYITEKLRQSGTEPQLATVDGADALVLPRPFDSGDYETWIFFAGDELREVTVAAGTQVRAGDGQAIMPLHSFTLERADGLLTVSVQTEAGQAFTTCIQVGGGKA